ncbi:MAG: serine hydrolase domain-containing protein [Pseudomonadota bacterium]
MRLAWAALLLVIATTLVMGWHTGEDAAGSLDRQGSLTLQEALVRIRNGDGNPALEAAGLSMVVFDRNGIVAGAAAGCRHFAGDRCLLMSTDAMARIASISKLVAATAAMRLVEEGKLALEGDIGDMLGFPVRNPAHPDTPITLASLMSHTSSLRDGRGYALPLGESLWRELFDPEGGHFDTRAPGAFFEYANINFGVLAGVMEKATGERFDRIVASEVLVPLNIEAGFNYAGVPSGKPVATLYRKLNKTGAYDSRAAWQAQLDGFRTSPALPQLYKVDMATPERLAQYEPGTNGTVFSPQGGLRISTRDLARFGVALFGGKGAVLKPETVSRMIGTDWTYNAHPPNGATFDGFYKAFGLSVHTMADAAKTGRTLVGHFGEAYGLRSALLWDEEYGQGFAYFITGMASNARETPGDGDGLSWWEAEMIKVGVSAIDKKRG